MRMQSILRLSFVAAALVASGASQAHISYSGTRNLGTLTAGSNATVTNQSVTSNYGWADASDLGLVFDAALATTPRSDGSFTGGAGTDGLYLGDSHKGRAFRFTLDTALTVTVTAGSRADSGLTPAFSVYQGLAAVAPFTAPQSSADHDFAPLSQAWRTSFAQGAAGASYDYLATQGSWNALGNWSVAGDGELASNPAGLSNFVYLGSAASTVANGTASTTLTLGPGDYTIFVGGNSLADKSVANSVKSYALTLGVSAVTPVPEPQTWALMLLGAGALVARRRATQH